MGKDKKTFLAEFNTIYGSLKSDIDKNEKILDSITAEGDDRKAEITKAFFSAEKKKTIIEQMKNLRGGPKDTSKEEILKWVIENREAIAVLGDENIHKNIDDKEFQDYKKNTPEPMRMIRDWLRLYNKYGNDLLTEEGEVRDPSKDAEAKSKFRAFNYYNATDMKFKVFISTVSANNMIRKQSPGEAAEYLKSLASSSEGKETDDIANFIAVYLISQRHPNDPGLITECRKTAEILTKKNSDDPRFVKFRSGKNHEDMMEKITKAEIEAIKMYKKTVRSKKNVTDKQAFSDFAEDLADAAKSTRRDSSEYKEIITWTNFLRDGADFSSNKFPKETQNQLNKLTDRQKEALPLYIIHNKLEKYLEHKARDGVKENTYNKLVVIEKMYQFISQRIKDINPGDFKFSIKGEQYDFKQANVHETFDAEYEAEPAKEKYFDSRVSSLYNVDEWIKDANKYAARKGYELNWEELENVDSCMNRIMLKVQKEQIRKKPGIDRGDLAFSISDLHGTRTVFLRYPVKPFRQSAETKTEEHTAAQLSR